MASPEFLDPYHISGTNVLANLFGADSTETLVLAEADLSFARALQLLDAPVAATNDLFELKRIHFHRFQDVYAWAGQTRTVDVRKDLPGADFFLPWNFIDLASANSFAELASEQMLIGLSRTAFVERLACHDEKINYIHPFREGNGQTQRIFWNRVALEA